DGLRLATPSRGSPRPAGPQPRDGLRLATPSLAADPRIEQAVREIDQEVDHDEHEREDEHRALQQDVVAREDRLDHETAEPWPREDSRGEHGAAHQLPRLQAEQGEDPDERVTQS